MKQTAYLVGLAAALVCIAPSIGHAQCLGDFNHDGIVTIDELVIAVSDALNGCPVTPVPTPTVTLVPATTPTANPTPPAARFVDNGDGTISDRRTGLMWEKEVKLDGTADIANLQDADNAYPWAGTCTFNSFKYCQPTAAASTMCTAGVEGDATGCAECTGSDGVCSTTDTPVGVPVATIWTWLLALNASNFAGHADWRLPKRDELQSIIDYTSLTQPVVNVAFQGASCGGACTDVTSAACSCTQPLVYWSASKYAAFPSYPWVIIFKDGLVFYDYQSSNRYVRAVRNAP